MRILSYNDYSTSDVGTASSQSYPRPPSAEGRRTGNRVVFAPRKPNLRFVDYRLPPSGDRFNLDGGTTERSSTLRYPRWEGLAMPTSANGGRSHRRAVAFRPHDAVEPTGSAAGAVRLRVCPAGPPLRHGRGYPAYREPRAHEIGGSTRGCPHSRESRRAGMTANPAQ